MSRNRPGRDERMFAAAEADEQADAERSRDRQIWRDSNRVILDRLEELGIDIDLLKNCLDTMP